MLQIVKVPDNKLRGKTKPVKKIDKKIKKLVFEMEKTLEKQIDPEGVGLAAPQIGKNIKLFIINFENVKRVIINPEVLEISTKAKEKKSENDTHIMEGCLSLPNYYGPLSRAEKIKIRYKNLHDKEVVEEFEGFLAQIVQHELDHLEGILFIDHIIKEKVPLYKLVGKKWEEVELI